MAAMDCFPIPPHTTYVLLWYANNVLQADILRWLAAGGDDANRDLLHSGLGMQLPIQRLVGTPQFCSLGFRV